MHKIQHWIGSLLLSVLGGASIGVGGTIYLSAENSVVGSLLFTIGLMTIYVFRWSLFTGKVGYASYRDPKQVFELLWVWIGNFIGISLTALAISMTRHAPKLLHKAETMVQAKVGDSLFSLFILAVFCGVLMYIAVEGYRSNPHQLGKYLALFLSVMVFILCGFEHCIANMFYFSLVGFTERSVVCLIVMSLGNLVGGAGCARLTGFAHRLYSSDKQEEAQTVTSAAS